MINIYKMSGLVLVIAGLQFFAIFSFAQNEPPPFFTLDGRLFEAGSSTDPLLDSSIVMTIQILNPLKSCILYEETESLNTLATNGFFTARIGSVTGAPERASRDSNNSMKTVFVNSGAAITGKTAGGGGCTYTPVAGETRQFRFFISPSTVGGTAQLSEDMLVDSVPQALVAQTLQGLDPSNIFQTSATSTQAKLDNLLTTNYTALSDVISGTSSLYLQNDATGTQLPTRATDPAGPTPGQIWFDTVANQIKYFNGSTIQSVGASGAGISSLTAGAGLSGGTITTSGTIAIDTAGVTNAMLATGIDASKITAGTLPAGVVPTNTDTTKLPLAGGTLTGAVTMGAATTFAGFDLLNTGHITMNAQRTITIGRYDGTQQTTLVGTLNGTNAGATWFNTSTGKLMYWNGAAAFEMSETTSSGGDITAITTNTGSGLTGGVLSGPATLAVNVDNTTIEVATNTIQLKDGGIAAAKLAADSVTTAKILDGEIVNADINAAAAIAWSKINKTGAVASDVGAVGTARNINTASGSGLTGGGDLSADRSISMVVDNSTIEIATNTVQVRDGGITNAKINTVGVSKIVSGATEYFSYMPAGTECATGEVLKWDAVTNRWLCDTDATGASDHGLLTGLLDDDHTQYVLLAGRSGGQNLRGGTAASNNLTLESTSNATKGFVILQPTGGNVGIGTTNPTSLLQMTSDSTNFQYLSIDAARNHSGSYGLVFSKSRGNFSGRTATQSGDVLGDMVFTGWTAAGAYSPGVARIRAYASEIPTATSAAGALAFETTPTTTTTVLERMRIDSDGNVGIGTTDPDVKLDVEGTVQIGDGGEICSIAANAGMVKYATGSLQYCNGSAWQTLGVSGSGLTTLNAQTGSTQTFANGTTGTAPLWNSASNIHTLNIPLASGAGVTSGTITKVEYDSFTAKLSSVTGSGLSSARIWVGDSGNLAQPVLVSGDATLSNAGALTIANDAITTAKINNDAVTSAKILNGEIVNADINAAAAIAWSKIDKTGATAADVGAVGTARNINTVSGSGLTGGGDLSADRSISMVVDNSTIEIATNTVQVKDGGITNAKINTVAVSKIVSGAAEYFSYMPAGTECATGEVLKWDAVTNRWLCDTDATGGGGDHGTLTGLTDDDHAQYALLAGRAAGQTFRGGTASGDDLTIESTSNATKGDVILQPNGGFVGIGTTNPNGVLDVRGGTAAAATAGSSIALFAQNSGAGASNQGGSIVLATGDGAGGFLDGDVYFDLGTGRTFYNSSSSSIYVPADGWYVPGASFIVRNDSQTSGSAALQSFNVANSSGLEQHSYFGTVSTGGPGVYTPQFVWGIQTAAFNYEEKMRLNGSGQLGIGTTNPTVSLDLSTKTDAIRIPAGTTGEQPTATNGMIRYNTTTNKFEGYENGGWVNFRDPSSNSNVTAAVGTAVAPSISFTGEADTGFYGSGTNSVGVSAGGAHVFDFNTVGLVSPTAGGANILSGNGTQATPTFGFAGDTDTGWFRPAADTMAASTAGVEKLRIDSLGNIGIGTTTTVYPFDLKTSSTQNGAIARGVVLAPSVTSDTAGLGGVALTPSLIPSAALGNIFGNILVPTLRDSSSSVINYQASFFRADLDASYTGNITSLNTIVAHPPLSLSSGAITNMRGLFIADMESATNEYGVFQNGADDTNYFAGNIGIGTSSPSVALEVNGAIVSQTKTNGAGVTNINFINGNVQTSANSTNNAAFNICGLKDGGSYTLVLTAQPVSSIPTFAAFSDAACSTGITWVDAGGVTLQTTSATTVLTFIRAGNTVYVMLATGFTH